MFRMFRRDRPGHAAAQTLYAAVTAQARVPEFYRNLGVPDTIDGRFDLLVLHLFVVMDALKKAGAPGRAVGAELANAAFAGFDQALRDLGVGDFGIFRRIKAMANAFYGRIDAYAGAAQSPRDLAAAILRNVYRGEEARAAEAAILANYIKTCCDDLGSPSRRPTLCEGQIVFPPIPRLCP